MRELKAMARALQPRRSRRTSLSSARTLSSDLGSLPSGEPGSAEPSPPPRPPPCAPPPLPVPAAAVGEAADALLGTALPPLPAAIEEVAAAAAADVPVSAEPAAPVVAVASSC